MVNTAGTRPTMGVTSILSPISKLRHFTKSEIREFSAFQFSLHLIFDQILSNLIV